VFPGAEEEVAEREEVGGDGDVDEGLVAGAEVFAGGHGQEHDGAGDVLDGAGRGTGGER
jgi:hypothetical protein